MRFWSLFRTVRGKLLWCIVMLAISGVAMTAVPLATAWALNDGLLGSSVHLRPLVFGSLLAIGFWFAFSFAEGAKNFLALQAGAQVATELREKMYQARVSARLSHLRRGHDGTQASRIMHDASEVSVLPTLILNGALGSAVNGISTIIAMIMLDYRLAIVAFLLVIPASLVLRGIHQKVSERTVEYFDSISSVNAHLADHLSLDSTVLSRIFDRQSWVYTQFMKASRRLAASEVQRDSAGLWPTTLMNALLLSGPVLLYLTVGAMVPSWIEGLGAGTLVAFTSLQVRLPYGVSGTLAATTQLRAVRTLMKRIVSEYEETLESGSTQPSERYKRTSSDNSAAVEVSACSFSYEGQEPVLDDITLRVDRGEWLLLTGVSGAGKSTLLRVLTGLEDVHSGSIKVNVLPLPTSQARPTIDLVPQKPHFLTSSLFENMRFAVPDVTEEDVWSALSTVLLDDAVRAWPEQLYAPIGIGGTNLSGGELQRLALARSVLRRSSIIFLDEATSALDQETERRVWNSLCEAWSDRTVIVVSHRPSQVPANRNIVLSRASDT